MASPILLFGLVSTLTVTVNCIPAARSDGFRVSICDNLSRFERRSCSPHLLPGDSEAACKAFGCCFDSSESVGARYFYPDRQKTDPLSFKNANANTYKDSFSGQTSAAEASAHILSTDFKVATGISAKTKLAEASARASAAVSDLLGDGVGVSADATVFEAGVRTNVEVDGLHWIGAGAKVGLSARTEFTTGLRESSLKVLGTGLSFGSEKGLEVCIFGSCVWLG